MIFDLSPYLSLEMFGLLWTLTAIAIVCSDAD